MLGLDDSEKSNFLEEIDIALCLGTLEVPVFYSVCPLTCSEVQVCREINFPNEGMINEEPEYNYFYVFKHRLFCLEGD